METVNITCVGCGNDFDHIIITRNTNAKKFCDECLQKKKSAIYRRKLYGYVGKRHTYKVEIPKIEKEMALMTWDEPNYGGY